MKSMHLIVGCGLSGAVIAERIASVWKEDVLIIEKRDHIGGNCYDYVDDETGIRMNQYGAHLFHTNDKGVWEYVKRFDTWTRWEHKVLSMVDGQYVPVPVNITTVNQVCGENLEDTDDMDSWLSNVQYKGEIANSEDMAVSRVGRVLYEKMFKPYTIKQWNKGPEELDPSVLARIPIRRDFDVRYFSDKFQALPAKGYTHFFERLLDHPKIRVQTGVDFFKYKAENDITVFKSIFYTGPVDQYFEGADLKRLEYRSIDFHIERHQNMNYFQPCSVVNYPETDVPFTRIVEYKHFLNQTSDHTVTVKETTNDHGDPYYPIPNKTNMDLYEQYRKMAVEEEKKRNVYFVGRLANYKYMNMDQAIRNALNLFDRINANPDK
uniref:UDP-galactopyranose mutase C-terminal domain-containing protein n=1 Tax=Ciona savignyi TaxID=51511 RepID=H2Y526_CIOSA